jgi:hypothetical protein
MHVAVGLQRQQAPLRCRDASVKTWAPGCVDSRPEFAVLLLKLRTFFAPLSWQIGSEAAAHSKSKEGGQQLGC